MDTSLKNFVIDGSERSVNDTLSKLRFIAKIKPGDKLDINSMTLMEDSWSTTVYRTYRSIVAKKESKSDALEFFRTVIGEAFDLATKYLSSNDKFFLDIGVQIVELLQLAKVGINNHIQTYTHDSFHTAKVESLITILDTKLKTLINRTHTLQRSKLHGDSLPESESSLSSSIPGPESLMLMTKVQKSTMHR